METLLFLAATEADGTLSKASLEAFSAAKELAAQLGQAPLLVGLWGASLEKAPAALGGAGVRRLLGVEGPAFGPSRYATDLLATEALVRASGASLVLTPATQRLNRVLAGTARRTGGCIDSHATSLGVQEGKPLLNRWFYRQRIEAVLTRKHRPWFIALEGGCAPAFLASDPAPALENLNVEVPATYLRTEVVGFQAPAADQQTIRPDASLLFVAGAGWTKKQSDGQTHAPEAEVLILEFLKKTKASLGSTKSLVDMSGEGQAVLKFMSHLNQIGQTGSTPRHPKGLATCCHGEEPHTVGWRFIGERRAINLNPGCSWAQGKADVLYIADSFAVMRKVNELLT